MQGHHESQHRTTETHPSATRRQPLRAPTDRARGSADARAVAGPAKPPVVRVPFRSVESMILVEGKVNGDPVTFLLDTGSVGTIVSTRMCRITCFSLHGVQRNADGHGINGESISVRLDLQLGNRQWAGQRVSIMNLDELSSILGVRHVDGLIGEDILRDFRSIRIDYHARVIELEE